MKASKYLCRILISLTTLSTSNILAIEQNESKTAYAILLENGQDFLIADEVPAQVKAVAGAHFTNAINQTG